MGRHLDMTQGARRAAVFLLCFTLLLFGATLVFTGREVNTVRASLAAAQRASASVVQLCQAGNATRAQQIGLWTHIITISSPPAHQTRVQRRQRAATIRAFVAYLHKVFAPRDCRAPLTTRH